MLVFLNKIEISRNILLSCFNLYFDFEDANRRLILLNSSTGIVFHI